MKKRISILSILAAVIFTIAAMQPAIPAASAEAVQAKTGTAEMDFIAAESIIAEKTEWAQLQEGDRFYIVNRAGETAISLNQEKTRLDQAAVTTEQTNTGRVITIVQEGAALFEKIDAGDGTVYLKSDTGYMTASEDAQSLFYAPEPLTGSRWRSEDGETLVNADFQSNRTGGEQPLPVCVEYYRFKNYFTSFAAFENIDRTLFIVDFYKAGNTRPDEPARVEHLYSLPVFETSDLHGVLADTSGDTTQYLMAYISDKVKDIRGYEPDTRKDIAVLLDGGDIYQGTTISSVTNGHALSAAMDMMGYDAVTVGNHEFDWGLDMSVDPDGTMPDYSLRQFVGKNKIPVVISNLFQDRKKLPGVQDYVILEKTARDAEGNELPVRVGVIGMADAYQDSILYEKFSGAGYSISLDYEAVNVLAAALKAGGQCDAVILLVHGNAADTAKGLGDDPDVDLVLGGHTHEAENWKTTCGLAYLAAAGKAASFAYCEMAFAKEADQPAFREIRNAGNVYTKAELREAAAKNRIAGELDPEIVMLTDTAIAAVSEVLGAEVGYITENAQRFAYFPESGERSSVLGNWACSITARMMGAEIGMINASGMRTGFAIPEGQDRRTITLENIYQLFPFDNAVYAFEITYEELKKVLEYSLTHRGHYLISEISGITCYYNNLDVLAMVTGDGNVIYDHGAWKDGWREKKVRVAMPDFLATSEREDRETGLRNPFREWQNTSRRLDISESQIEGSIRVLTEEAAENGGHLAIDTTPHYILVDAETAVP